MFMVLIFPKYNASYVLLNQHWLFNGFRFSGWLEKMRETCRNHGARRACQNSSMVPSDDPPQKCNAYFLNVLVSNIQGLST